ncbi:MAG: aminotransferase class V-fold PLP-dependent enzyme, partial [Clostridia bacterium]|nr:aminotransferase class V-fold PLP-dependent enzyme [Clostridia bacterium]
FIRELNSYAREKISALGFADINSPDDALPYVLNFSVMGYRSENLLHFLELRNIFVSSGSACARGELSPTLSAMKLPRDRIDSALRISFSRFNTKEDIDALCDGLAAAVAKLKRSK